MRDTPGLITIPRRRLTQLLSGRARLTLLHAPLGYGKTEVLRQWAAAQPCSQRPHWLGAGEFAPHPDKLKALIPPGTSTVIVDDYQEVTSAAMDEALVCLLEQNPNLRLVLASRSFEFLLSPLVHARVPTLVLGWEQLRFTPSETEQMVASAGLARATTHLGSDAEAAWPQGVQSGLLTELGAAPGDLSRGRLVHEKLELLDDPFLRDVFRALSTCSWLGPSVLSRFFGVDWEETLAAIGTLERAGLVVVAPAATSVRVSVHPALAQAAKEEATHHLEKRDARELRRLHADQLRALNPSQALAVVFEAGDYEAADRVATSAFGEPPTSEFHPTVLVQDLPAELIRGRPTLLHLRLWASRANPAVPFGVVRELSTLLKDAASKELRRNPADRPLIMQGNLLYAVRNLGEWDAAKVHSRDYYERLRSFPAGEAPGAAATAAFAYSLVATTGVLTGDYRLAARAGGVAVELAEMSGFAWEEARARGQLALIQSLVGKHSSAAAHLERAERLSGADRTLTGSPAALDAALAKLVLAYYQGEAQSVRQLLQDVLPAARRSERWPIFVIVEGGLTRQLQGDYQAFLLMAHRLRDSPQGVEAISPYWLHALYAQMANLATYAGRYRDAEKTLEGTSADTPLVLAARARLELFRGDAAAAKGFVDRGLRLGPHPRAEPDLLFIGAAAAFTVGDLAASAQYLQRALQNPHRWGPMVMTMLPYRLQQQVYEAFERKEGAGRLTEMLRGVPKHLRAEAYGPLSVAETRALRMISRELTIREAAAELYLSANTVKSQLRSAYRKLGVSGRAEALTAAHRLGILREPPPAAPERKTQ